MAHGVRIVAIDREGNVPVQARELAYGIEQRLLGVSCCCNISFMYGKTYVFCVLRGWMIVVHRKS
jgi:hypothetical protein